MREDIGEKKEGAGPASSPRGDRTAICICANTIIWPRPCSSRLKRRAVGRRCVRGLDGTHSSRARDFAMVTTANRDSALLCQFAHHRRLPSPQPPLRMKRIISSTANLSSHKRPSRPTIDLCWLLCKCKSGMFAENVLAKGLRKGGSHADPRIRWSQFLSDPFPKLH